VSGDRVLNDDHRVGAVFGQVIDGSSGNSLISLRTLAAMHTNHSDGSLLLFS